MQTIRHLRALAADMGITVAELVRRRAKRERLEVVADEDGTLRFRHKPICDPRLPGNYRIIFKTEYR